MTALKNFALSVPAPPAPCGDDHFGKCLRLMHAALPKRRDDDLMGKLAVSAYKRMLGHLPEQAISFITERALERCDWFPTIAECLRIAKEWTPAPSPDASARHRAAMMIRHETEARFDDVMMALYRRELDQAAIDALPERWKRIAVERCYLMPAAGGTYAPRPASVYGDDTGKVPA